MLNLIHETDGDSFDKKMTFSYLPLIIQQQCHNKRDEAKSLFGEGEYAEHQTRTVYSTGLLARLPRKAQLTHREPYQLRHSYASMLLMAGAHPAYLAKQFGHKDWGMIRTIYAQWVSKDNPNYRNELAEKLGVVDPYMTHEQQAKA